MSPRSRTLEAERREAVDIDHVIEDVNDRFDALTADLSAQGLTLGVRGHIMNAAGHVASVVVPAQGGPLHGREITRTSWLNAGSKVCLPAGEAGYVHYEHEPWTLVAAYRGACHGEGAAHPGGAR